MRRSARALSVRQPWAWLIVHGHKPVENRTWKTEHRGELLIHASLTFDDEAYAWVRSTFPDIDMPLRSAFERGALVGRVQVRACVTASDRLGNFGHVLDSPWYSGPVGWVLEDPEPLGPVAYRGMPGLFTVRGRAVGEVVRVTHVWYWRKVLPERKGEPCRVLARGNGRGPRNVLVEFEDGFQVVTARFAVRRLHA